MLNEVTDSGSRPASPSEEQLIKDIGGISYLGGSDTTVSLVVSFILSMLVYPEVQRRGQEEVDRIVGCERLPELSDREHLPYVNAIVSECYRWLPATAMGWSSSSSICKQILTLIFFLVRRCPTLD
jgi:cytochrome P450